MTKRIKKENISIKSERICKDWMGQITHNFAKWFDEDWPTLMGKYKKETGYDLSRGIFDYVSSEINRNKPDSNGNKSGKYKITSKSVFQQVFNISNQDNQEKYLCKLQLRLLFIIFLNYRDFFMKSTKRCKEKFRKHLQENQKQYLHKFDCLMNPK